MKTLIAFPRLPQQRSDVPAASPSPWYGVACCLHGGIGMGVVWVLRFAVWKCSVQVGVGQECVGEIREIREVG